MKTKYLLLTVLGFAALGCAKSNTPSTGETAQEYLNLWMDKYHPGIAQNTDGIYILKDIPGSGKVWESDTAYSYLKVTVKGLDGVVTSTSDENLSKQLGTYEPGDYYGPYYQATGQGASYAGLDAILSGMRVGGTREAVVPAWLITTNRYKTHKEYMNAASQSASLIYTVSLFGQTNDVSKTEVDSLKSYVTRHFGQVSPVSYDPDKEADGTFYFVSNANLFPEDDARTDKASGTINYTGRLLNGQVFDTTIEKVAKDAGIYNAAKSYAPVSVSFASSWNSVTMGGSSSLIDGFKGGLYLMKYVGEKAVIIFTSDHGYSTSGSGSSIPSWSPLQFEIELVTLSE